MFLNRSQPLEPTREDVQVPAADASASDAPVSRTPNRLQFGLRSLLLATLVGGLLLGRYGIRQYELAQEKAALRELQRYGADVQFYGGRAVGVSFSGASFHDDALAALDRLPRLQRLVFIDTALGDRGLAAVSQAQNLEQLLLLDSQVTDRGLPHLEKLHRLKTLRLDHAPITDEGLTHLARLVTLERLDLIGTRITDAGLMRLAELGRLEQLYLNQTAVTDAGAQRLQQRLPDTKIVW
jgi:hypothetical protein